MTHISNIANINNNTDPADTEGMEGEYCEQLYIHTFDNLHEMDHFFENTNSTLTQYERVNLINSITINFPGGASSKESACQHRIHERSGSDPWIKTIP